jgi:hypothetical protein
MFGGLALVTSIYVLLNFAFLRALGPTGLAASTFAAADAARLIFGRASEVLLSAVAVVARLSSSRRRWPFFWSSAERSIA